ncbi:hypothetical protein AbraIFM66950_009842 [Aspergillus brasiliensis]|nr:hypothetical protein AbraIFM66950_009842 [Aspergillus brasiliensis]
MKIRGVFDPEVVPPDKVEEYLHQMSDFLNLLLSSPSDTVGDVLRRATGYFDPEEVNKEYQVLDKVEPTAQTLLGQDTPLRAEWVNPVDTDTPQLALFVGCDGGPCVDPSSVFKVPDTETGGRLRQAMAELSTTLSSAMVPSLYLPVHLSSESVGFPSKADLQKEASKLPLETLQSYMCPQEASVIMTRSTSDIQTTLRRIMSLVLHIHIADVGLHDSFFTLGGDSILAMQVVAHCRKENINITAYDIFDAKTIHCIALRASPGSGNTTAAIQDRSFLPNRYQDIAAFEADLKQLHKLPRFAKVEDVYPCTDPHKGLLQKMNASFHPSCTIWEVTANGSLIDIERLLLAWRLVSKRHAALRTVLTEVLGLEYHAMLFWIIAPQKSRSCSN